MPERITMAVGKGPWRIHQTEEFDTFPDSDARFMTRRAVVVECWHENEPAAEPKTWTYYVLPGEAIWLRLLCQEYREAIALVGLVSGAQDDLWNATADWYEGYDQENERLERWLRWARDAMYEAEQRLLRKTLEGLMHESCCAGLASAKAEIQRLQKNIADLTKLLEEK